MERIYSIDDAKKKMEKNCAYYACRIEAWEKVTRNFKKDGGTFAILSKNFSNCDFVERFGSRYCSVSFRDENGSYCTDELNLDANRYHNTEEATTPEAVQNRIDGLLTNYKKWLEVDIMGLESIEEQLTAIIPQLDSLKKAIAEAKTTNTHYTMQSFIKNYLGILND